MSGKRWLTRTTSQQDTHAKEPAARPWGVVERLQDQVANNFSPCDGFVRSVNCTPLQALIPPTNLFHRLRLTEDAVELLSAYDWPGNMRELQNVIERAVILSQRGVLRIDLVLGDSVSTPPVVSPHLRTDIPAGIVLSQKEMDRREHENILAALEKARGRIYRPGCAAEVLCMKPTTLAYQLKRMGIKRPM